MKLKSLLGTMEGLSSFAKLNATSNTFLAVAVCLLTINQMGQHETTRLIPPTLDKEVKIGWKSADDEYRGCKPEPQKFPSP